MAIKADMASVIAGFTAGGAEWDHFKKRLEKKDEPTQINE